MNRMIALFAPLAIAVYLMVGAYGEDNHTRALVLHSVALQWILYWALARQIEEKN